MMQMAFLAAMVGPRVAAAAAQAALEALAAEDPAAAQEAGDGDTQMSDGKPSGEKAWSLAAVKDLSTIRLPWMPL